MSPEELKLPRRVLDRILVVASSGCWEWTGTRFRLGYGSLSWKSNNRCAHIVVWENLNGKVPTGLELDHICRNPGCVNPEHLEPVTHRVNVLRGAGITAIKAAQTLCIRGHPLSIKYNGMRFCRTCNNAQRRAQRARKL